MSENEDEDEVRLGGGWSVDGVVRVGDTVRRPPLYATQLMRDTLMHLERSDFDGAPRWLGFDDRGRDVLTFLAGDTYSDCRAIVWRDEQLAASARLLRRYHDAIAASDLAAGREVVCHGDFGPWNLIWRDDLPRFAIDFDNAHPGERAEDVGYALRAHLNPALVELPATEQARRASVYLDAYGLPFDARELLEAEHAAAEARCRGNGWLIELAAVARQQEWLARNRAAFQ